MHEELYQFVQNDVWELVPRPNGVNVIGTKWSLRTSLMNITLLSEINLDLLLKVTHKWKGLTSMRLLHRLESIRILLAIASHLNFKLYQMDVKSAFLNGMLQEEVYMEQPKGFVDSHRPDDVYKLKRALYGLKQTPRAWYGRLTA